MMIGQYRFIIDFYGNDIFYNTYQSINKYYKGFNECQFLEDGNELVKIKIDQFLVLDSFMQAVLKRRSSDSFDCFIHQKNKNVIELIVKSANGLLHKRSHKNINLKQLISHYQHFFDKIRNRNLLTNEENKAVNFFENVTLSENKPGKIKSIKMNEKEHYQQFSLVQAIATQSSQFGTGFDLFTADSSFYYMNDGEGVYEKMSKQLMSMRKNGANYPIFITDLDLSATSEKVSLVELLSYKQTIENKLNQ